MTPVRHPRPKAQATTRTVAPFDDDALRQHALYDAYHAGGPDAVAALEALMASLKGFVAFAVLKAFDGQLDRHPTVAKDDAIQEAMLAALGSVTRTDSHRWSPDKGATLRVYACRAGILAAKRALEAQNGAVSLRSYAARKGDKAGRVGDRVLSLSRPIGDEGAALEVEAALAVAACGAGGATMTPEPVLDGVDWLVSRLPRHIAPVVVAHYGLGTDGRCLSVDEIADMRGLQRRTVQEMLLRAGRILRAQVPRPPRSLDDLLAMLREEAEGGAK